MKLQDILNENNFHSLLEGMLEPDTARPPKEKGSDAIKVCGYFVHGHWRRRWKPSVRKLKLVHDHGHRRSA
jgi:hypothetical protein